MNWRQHLVGGVIVYVALSAILLLLNVITMSSLIICLPITAYFSLFPDVDIASSKVRQLNAIIFSTILFAFLIVIYLVPGSVQLITLFCLVVFIVALYLAVTSLFVKHRGVLHSPFLVFGICVFLFVIGVGVVYILYVFAGFVSSCA